MKILKTIQSAIHLRSPGPTCHQCAHFQNDPSIIEKMYPGLKTMSSGYASIRDSDGFCNLHQLYLSARDTCSAIVPSPDARCNTTGQTPPIASL